MSEPQLDAKRMTYAEQERAVFRVVVEPGVTRAQILNPAFLAHVARDLKPYSKLEIINDDGTMYAEAIVLQAERSWAKIAILSWHDLTTRDVSQTEAEGIEIQADDHRVEWKGPHKKWCVIRTSDSKYLREKEASRQDAELWLREYLKVTA